MNAPTFKQFEKDGVVPQVRSIDVGSYCSEVLPDWYYNHLNAVLARIYGAEVHPTNNKLVARTHQWDGNQLVPCEGGYANMDDFLGGCNIYYVLHSLKMVNGVELYVEYTNESWDVVIYWQRPNDKESIVFESSAHSWDLPVALALCCEKFLTQLGIYDLEFDPDAGELTPVK